MTDNISRGGGSPPIQALRPTIPQLDTVRVAAMLGVFLHHLWNTVFQTPVTSLQWVLDVIFDTASDGVILFNIISGFVLALPFFGPGSKPFPGYRTFLTRRCLRIIPPYYLALLLFSVANVVVFSFPLESALNMLTLHLLFVNSLDYSMMNTNFAHFWYIGMLVQFYLLFPLLLGLFRRFGPWRAALLLTGICYGGWGALALYVAGHPDSWLGTVEYLFHFNIPGRLPEFALGMWAAALWLRPASSPARRLFDVRYSLVCVFSLLIVVLGTPFVPGMKLPLLHIYHVALCQTLFAAFLVWKPIAQLGTTRWMKDLSMQSYAVYIVHVPLFSYLGVMPGKVPHTLTTFMLLTAAFLLLSYLGARGLNWLSDRAIRLMENSRSVLTPLLCPSCAREEKKR